VNQQGPRPVRPIRAAPARRILGPAVIAKPLRFEQLLQPRRSLLRIGAEIVSASSVLPELAW